MGVSRVNWLKTISFQKFDGSIQFENVEIILMTLLVCFCVTVNKSCWFVRRVFEPDFVCFSCCWCLIPFNYAFVTPSAVITKDDLLFYYDRDGGYHNFNALISGSDHLLICICEGSGWENLAIAAQIPVHEGH